MRTEGREEKDLARTWRMDESEPANIANAISHNRLNQKCASFPQNVSCSVADMDNLLAHWNKVIIHYVQYISFSFFEVGIF